MNPTRGFAPILGTNPRVLILGTLPSQKSLEKNQYYGHPQNAFWQIMRELFDAGPALPYAERTERIKDAGIAVWDVLHSSRRPGSMDSAIDQETAEANDFEGLFRDHPDITLVCFNGKMAAQLFSRLVADRLADLVTDVEFVTLPSTSPAYASMRFDEKLKRWSILKQVEEKRRAG